MYKNIYSQFKYWGFKNFCLKVHEKLWIDRKRFSTEEKQTVPQFPDAEEPLLSLENTVAAPERVFYLTHYFYPIHQGGTERFVLNMAQEMRSRGSHVTVFAFGTENKNKYTDSIGEILYRRFSINNIEVIEFRYKKTPFGMMYKHIDENDETLYKFAERFLKEKKPSVVHCAYPQPMASFLKACNDYGVPYVLTLTDFNIFCHYATMVRQNGEFCNGCQQGTSCNKQCATQWVSDFQKRYQVSEKILKQANAITVPSQFVANVIHNEYPEILPYVVPHGISDVFSHNKTNHCKKFPPKKIAYVGTISELKGINLLIDAFSQIKGDLKLSIYGSGNSHYVERLKKQASKDKRIAFCGHVSFDQIPRVYEENDCIVVPSVWYETYNFVVREALASGCLTIASNIGAMPEAIAEGENGFLFTVGNSNSLKEALKKAIDFYGPYKSSQFPTVKNEADKYQTLYSGGKYGA